MPTFDKAAEQIFATVFGRNPESPQERSFLNSMQSGMAPTKTTAAPASPTGTSQPASTNPQANQVDPQQASDNALDAAQKALIDSQKKIQQANMNIFKKEAQLALKQELLKNPAIQKLLQKEGQVDSQVASFNPAVQGSELARPTQQGGLLSQALQNQIQSSGDIGRAFATRGQGISGIIQDITAQREQDLKGAQTEQASATNLISQLLNINEEKRAQEDQKREEELFPLQKAELRAKIAQLGESELDKPISLKEAADYGLPQGTTYRQLQGQVLKATEDGKPPTAAQETVATYASRLEQSNKVFDSLENYTNDLSATANLTQKSLPEYFNFLKSGNFQSLEQAQRNFLNATLRRESGAVISPTEFAEGRKQYFPQPGDKPEVLAQKKANRQVVVNSFIKGAGSAYLPLDQLLGTSSNVVIAPDGQQVEIID